LPNSISSSSSLALWPIYAAGELELFDRDYHFLFLNDFNDCKRIGSDPRIGEVNHRTFQLFLFAKNRSELLGAWKKNVTEMKPNLVSL